MNSYFFIPATNKKFVDKIQELDSDYFILDFEDSVNQEEIINTTYLLRDVINQEQHYARIYWDSEQKQKSINILKLISELNFKNFVVPKVKSKEELEEVVFHLSQLVDDIDQIMLLVENPALLFELPGILKGNRINAIALGSHDYCSEMGMKHSLDNYGWARDYLLNLAKANNITVIDVASMNISDESSFLRECQNGFDRGFDGKFFIHPNQLTNFRKYKFYTAKELSVALKVKEYIKEIGGVDYFVITRIDGVIIERPHLNRIKSILNVSQNGSF